MIAFFHQNEVVTPKGGIERYLATLLESAGDKACFVTEETGNGLSNRIGVTFRGPERLPRWLRFTLGILADRQRIRSELAKRNVTTLECSRPEYTAFAGLFPGKRVFTFHGQGGLWSVVPVKRFIHLSWCYLLPVFATRIQVVGQDNEGMPWPVRSWFNKRISNIDVWFDNKFKATPLPPLEPFRVFYSGRLNDQKNPDLLIEIIRKIPSLPFPVHFTYFGPDSAVLKPADLGAHFTDLGLLNVDGLVKAIGENHVGMLCSHFEGSPFAMIETLGSGRCFISSPLPSLMGSYKGVEGVFFAREYTAEGFLDAIARARAYMLTGVTADHIAGGVADRAQDTMAKRLINDLTNA